jgi:hypothetical protein
VEKHMGRPRGAKNKKAYLPSYLKEPPALEVRFRYEKFIVITTHDSEYVFDQNGTEYVKRSKGGEGNHGKNNKPNPGDTRNN